MINWLSNYNYDYAIAAIPVHALFLAFYFSHKNLPIRKNKSFLLVLWTTLIMNISDIMSCEMVAIHSRLPIASLYIINIIYFSTFFIRNWSLYDYTIEDAKVYKFIPYPILYAMAIPMLIAIIITVTSPITHWLFYIDSTGYHNSIMYPLLYISSSFYRIISLICVFISIKHLSHRTSISLIAMNFILLIGLFIRRAYPNVLIMSFFSLIAIMIIYLSSLNPDLYRVRRVDLFSDEAFERIIPDLIRREIPFECLCICIQNFATLNTLYNPQNLKYILSIVGKWLIKKYPHCTIFYFGNGQLVILNTRQTLSLEEEISTISEKFTNTWKYKNYEVSFPVTYAFLPKTLKVDSFYSTYECLQLGMTECSLSFKRVNTVLYIDESYLERVHRTEEVARAIGKAIKNRTLMIYLQPLYSATQRRITAAEALARLYDEELGFIPPNEFISIAENNGQIIELGRQIFDETCKFINEHDLDSLGIDFINVNLSPTQCMNENLADELLETIYKYNIPTNRINLEITESSIEDLSIIRYQMDRLSNVGLRFSMDDFGSGTSNVARLVELPFTIVKLDMSLVWSYFRGTSKILKSQIEMFLNEQMKIVAEGVEDEHMANELAALGCEYEQGFYYSKPLPVDEFIKLIEDNSYAQPSL
ncbi:EAL domain-containing protein [Lachnobacterium bovis]|uniref:EAL domain-containing protein n=1 Tax=Lachnobacterium bovis TaxID=140626 RepID=UPI0003B57274|nr:EAL domain-containing protein [Lachnobacterium bovis]